MDNFFQRVFDIVKQIPEGRVTTYGQIARMIGEPRKARYVGFAMHQSPGVAGGVPCHRVVFKDGSLAPGFESFLRKKVLRFCLMVALI